MSDVKIRKLTVQDRIVLTGLLKRFMLETNNSTLANLIQADEGAGKATKSDDGMLPSLGLEIIKNLLNVFESEMGRWFSDLIKMEYEEYVKLPFDTEVKIIEQIVEAEEFSGFFSRASALYKKITGLLDKQKT